MLKIRILNSYLEEPIQETDLKPEGNFAKDCFIGRGANNHLVLNSNEVSQFHGKISWKDGKSYYVDLCSKNGSYINTEQAKINQLYPLNLGDSIRIGRFILIIIGIAEIEPPLTPEEYMPVAMVPIADIKRWESGKLTVSCVRIIDETIEVKTFCFVANPPVLFTYKPGQFVTLHLEINGKKVSRCYSISSTPSRPHTLEITVKRTLPPPNSGSDIPAGLVSNWLHDNIRLGSEVNLSGPMGEFTCFAHPWQKLLLISAGSGITPMMSMSQWIIDTASKCDIVFLHSDRRPRDIIFRKRLELMSELYPNFHLAITTTRANPDDNWMGLTGRIDATMLKKVAPDFLASTVYVCGPNPFMEGVKEMLTNLGFPMQNYYSESFGSSRALEPKPIVEQKESSPSSDKPPYHGGIIELFRELLLEPIPPDRNVRPPDRQPVSPDILPRLNETFSPLVVFSKSGKEVACDGEDSILVLAESEELKTIKRGCGAGNCGACKTRKLSGEVKMEEYNYVFSESELKQGYILTCISYPLERVEMDA